MKLSKRLELVASFVKEGSTVADLGTDHGYIPIVLVERGVAGGAIAMDVRTGPLLRAREHIRLHGLEDRIETRLSDGARLLEPGEADTVVIAGMGGELVIHILEEGRHLWNSVDQWVLSPQSELWKVRRFLKEQGFLISREGMVEEDGKYYTVMEAVRGEMGEMTRAQLLYGKCLIQDKNPVLGDFLRKEEKQMKTIRGRLANQRSKAAARRLRELKWELLWVKEARNEMQ